MTRDKNTGSPGQQRRDPGRARAKKVTGADCGADRIGPDRTVLALIQAGTKRCRLLAAFMAVAFGLVGQSATVAHADSTGTVLFLDAPSISDGSAARAGEVAEAYAADGSPTATETFAWLALPEGSGGGMDTGTLPGALPEGTREAFASVTAQEPSSSGGVTTDAALAAGETMLAQLEDVDVKEPGAAEDLAVAGAVRPVLGGGTAAEATPEKGAEEDAPAVQPPDTGVPDFEPPELASVPEEATAEVGVSGKPDGATLVVEGGDPETEVPEARDPDAEPGVGEGVELASAPSESVPTAEPDEQGEQAGEVYGESGPLTDTGPMDEPTSESEEPPSTDTSEEPSEPSEPTEEVALAPTTEEATTGPMESAPADDGTDHTGYGSSPPATEPTAEPVSSQPTETAETAPAFPAGEATGPTGYEGEEGEIALAPVPGDSEPPEDTTPATESAPMDDGQFSGSTQSTQENQLTQETQDVQSPATPVAEETTPVSPVVIEQAPDGTNEDGGTEGSGGTTLREGEASQPNSPDGAPIPTEEASGPEAEYEIVVGESEDDMLLTPPESSEPEAGGSPASAPEGAPDRTPEDQPTASPENGNPDGGGGEANAPAAPGGEAPMVEVEEPTTEAAPSAPAGDAADPGTQGAGGAGEPAVPTPPAEEAQAPGVGRPRPEVREDRQAQRHEQYRAEREAKRHQQAQGALQTGPYQHATVEQQGGQVEIVEDQQVVVEVGEDDIARAERHAERRAARQEAVAVEQQRAAEQQAAIEQQQALEAAALEQARQQHAYERQVAAENRAARRAERQAAVDTAAAEQQLAYEQQQIAEQQAAARWTASEQQQVLAEQQAITEQQAAIGQTTAGQQAAQQGVVDPQVVARAGYTQPATANVPQSVPQSVEQTYAQPVQQAVPEQVQPAGQVQQIDHTAAAAIQSQAQPEPRVAQAAQPDHTATAGTTPQTTPTVTAAPAGEAASGAAGGPPAAVSRQQVSESVSNVTREVSR